MLRAFLMVGLGGMLGSMARYGAALLLARIWQRPFPLATLLVNLTGCLLIGLLAGLAQRQAWLQGPGWLLLATGFCGGLTTFSTFALESTDLLQRQLSITALLYAALSLFLGILLCRLGFWLTA